MNIVPVLPKEATAPTSAAPVTPSFELGDILVAAPSCWMLQPGSRWEVVHADPDADVYKLRPDGCLGAGYIVVSGASLSGQVMRDSFDDPDPDLDEFPPAGSVLACVGFQGVVEYSPNGRRWRLLFDLEKCWPGTPATGAWQYGAVPAPWRQVAE